MVGVVDCLVLREEVLQRKRAVVMAKQIGGGRVRKNCGDRVVGDGGAKRGLGSNLGEKRYCRETNAARSKACVGGGESRTGCRSRSLCTLVGGGGKRYYRERVGMVVCFWGGQRRDGRQKWIGPDRRRLILREEVLWRECVDGGEDYPRDWTSL